MNELELQKIEQCLIYLAICIENGEISNVTYNVMQDLGYTTTKNQCKDCCNLPEGEVIKGHDHRKITN